MDRENIPHIEIFIGSIFSIQVFIVVTEI